MISRFPMPRVLAASIAMGLSVSAGVSELAIAAAPQLHPDAGARSAENVQRYIVRKNSRRLLRLIPPGQHRQATAAG